MRLYHFTTAASLRPISRHGLTIGDVPLDLRTNRGRVGVWLTSSPERAGHGLARAGSLPVRYRLAVEIEPCPALVRWIDWAPGNVTPETINNLTHFAGTDGPSQASTWFVNFGVIPVSAIVECWDTEDQATVPAWADAWPETLAAKGVPSWRREAWHRNLQKNYGRHLRAAQAAGIAIGF